MKSILIKNATIVTMDTNRRVLKGDLLVQNGLISKIAKSIRKPTGPCQVVDATDRFVLPGLIQTHVHLCQILFRGEADDLALLEWLGKKIWPMEKAHTKASLRAGARLGLLEMQKAGTTTILDMGTVSHTDALFEAAEESGIRYWGGKCFMDAKDRSGPLYESTERSFAEVEELINSWHLKTPRLNFVLSPRFAISCTEELLLSCADWQKEKSLLVHTHASESLEEIDLIRKLTGLGNIEYFEKLGLLNPQTVIVHGVHMSDKELRMMVDSKTPLVHCPAANLKLASGIAPIEKYRKQGLTVGLGCDGAPCNNTMDPFLELRLAALIQKPGFGPTALPAAQALELATIGGAKVLGIEEFAGSLEVGKWADIVLIDRSHPSVATVDDPYSAVVYSALGRDVTDVMIGGDWVVRHRRHTRWDEEKTINAAKSEKKRLLSRV